MDFTRRSVASGMLLTPAAAVLGGLPAWASSATWSTLGTREQIAKEALALRILGSDPVQRELHNLEQLYAGDPIASLPLGQKTANSAAASMAMNAVLGAVNKDVDRPVILWGSNSAHRWHKLDVPRSGLVQDNPDNVYRSIPIDGAARYEITGKVNFPAPAQETFVLYGALPGTSSVGVKVHLEEAGSVALDQLAVGPDGSFTITIDSSAADGRPNHLQTSPDARQSVILIRDTLSDWASQNPVGLSIERLSGPPIQPALTEGELAVSAAQLLHDTSQYWLNWEHHVYFSYPANIFSLSFARATGWGYTKAGHYQLADDEALIATIDRLGANYFAVQVADLWGPSVDSIDRNGSLNNTQASANADGTYSFVIAVNDPGVHNWLDPSGLPAGTFQVRWQKLPSGMTDEGAVKVVKVVKVGDLKNELPAETKWVTPQERSQQLADRAASYARRLAV